jgi:hypothetical protein
MARGLAAVARASLAATALASEFGAADALLRNSIVVALALHVTASVLAGAAAAAYGCERRGRWVRFAFALVLSGSLPGVGVLGVLLVVVLIVSRVAATDTPKLLCLSRPDWQDSCLAAADRAEHMLARRRSPSQRIQVLLSQRGMPAASAVPGLRAALRDPADEVRLLAHALLDRRETQLRAAIGRIEAELAAATDSSRRWQLLGRLAHSYWALVDGELAHGELAQEALERASRSAKEALELARSGDLCVLLVEVCLRQSDGLAAWHWLQCAERERVPLDVRAPLYAEAAFLLRRFEQIPHWLRRAGVRQPSRPKFTRVAALWLRELRNSPRVKPNHS